MVGFFLRQLHRRETLDKLISRALGVPYNTETGHIDLLDDMQYVMTLDYAVKMLTIHERRMCGVPLVISGETGVGKTYLLETLSALWNYALLVDLDRERDRLKEDLRRDLNNCVLNAGHLEECKAKELNEALQDLAGKGETSISTLAFVLNERAPCRREGSHATEYLYQAYLPKLLMLKEKPVFSILLLPECDSMKKYKTFVELFSRAETGSKTANEVEKIKLVCDDYLKFT